VVWNNSHKSRGFDRIHTEDLQDFDERLRHSFSNLDCIFDENKAKMNDRSNSAFLICLCDNFLIVGPLYT
jgi:hypothetical protein